MKKQKPQNFKVIVLKLNDIFIFFLSDPFISELILSRFACAIKCSLVCCFGLSRFRFNDYAFPVSTRVDAKSSK